MTEEPLFDTSRIAAAGNRLQPGDEVLVQLMWGIEKATVLNVRCEDGFALVSLRTSHGDEVSVTPGRVMRDGPTTGTEEVGTVHPPEPVQEEQLPSGPTSRRP